VSLAVRLRGGGRAYRVSSATTRIVVHGHVGGDVSSTSGAIHVDGNVYGAVETTSGSVHVGGAARADDAPINIATGPAK